MSWRARVEVESKKRHRAFGPPPVPAASSSAGAGGGGGAAKRAKFWRPNTMAPGLALERTSGGDDGAASADGPSADMLPYNPNVALPLRQQRELLPVRRRRREILYAIEVHKNLVVTGETGSGKTTQVPQYLVEAGWAGGGRLVVCTQPRRVAAATVAARVAEERGGVVGHEVGYAVRFDRCMRDGVTKLLYASEGALLREMHADPLLSRYAVVMVDEAHERSLQTDTLLGLLRKVQRARRDLRIIVASATLDVARYRRFFGGSCAVVCVEGRQHPVETFHAEKPVRDYMHAAAQAVLLLHRRGDNDGGVLVFVPSRDDVYEIINLLRDEDSLSAVPLHGGLSHSDQLRAFQRPPRGVRKVVVATPVAETSVTVPGIAYVVDTGLTKLLSHERGITALTAAPTSRATAAQRAGRAGRDRPGQCFRLYTEEAFWREMPERTPPEVERVDLTSLVLQVKSLGVDDLGAFQFVSKPSAQQLASALELLHALGALDDGAKLTRPLGYQLAELPVDARMGRFLLASCDTTPPCVADALTTAAMLQVRGVWARANAYNAQRIEAAKRKLTAPEGDHLTLMRVFDAYLRNGKDAEWCRERYLDARVLNHAIELRRHLRRHLARVVGRRVDDEDDDESKGKKNYDALRRCVVRGYFSNAASLMEGDGTYSTVRGQRTVTLHKSSALFGARKPWIVFHEAQDVGGGLIEVRDATAIDPMWLPELAPDFFTFRAPSHHHHGGHAHQQTVADKAEGTVLNDEGQAVRHRHLF